MAYERSTLQYWNGSSWITAVTAEGSNINALMAAEIVDGLGTPQTCIASLINRSSTPYNNTPSNRAGPLTGVFTDFMPIRIMDEESKAIIFYGNVYNVSEKYDRQYGNLIELTCRDGLSELRDNPTDGQYGFTINPSGTSVVNPESSVDTETRLYTSTISKRSDAIKSLINLGTRWDAANNVSYNIDTSDTERFEASAATFRDSGELRFGSQSQKSALAHIATLAATDATALSGGATSTRTAFTYDYYLDPNFQNPSANHKPKAHFNYFKRGTRPTDSSDPENYGFKVEYGSTTVAAGRTEAMLDDFDFERPKGELYTDAIVHYTDTGVYNDTADGDKVQTTVQRMVRMELIKIRNLGNGTGWTKLKTSPIWEHGTSLASPSSNADYIEAQISGTWTKVARLQYLSADSGGTASSPEYAIISEVAANFPDTAGTLFRHSSGVSTSTFLLVGRQSTDFGIRRTFRTSASNATRPDEVREAVASKIMRGAKQLVRGKFRVLRKPLYYVDNSPTSVSGSSANQTINFSNDEHASTLEPHKWGIRKGMTVNKLSGGQPSEIYGQILSAANGGNAANVYWSSGTASGSDTLRYYVPIRAGDLIYVTNDLVGVHGMKMLVTKVHYAEQPGVSSMSIEVVGSESKADGSWAKVSTAAATAAAASQAIELPPTQEMLSSAGTSVGGQTFNTGLDIKASGSSGSGNAAPHRHVEWEQTTITMSGGISCNILAGGDSNNNGTGPYNVVDDAGNITQIATLAENNTYTAFIDFGRSGQEGDKNKTLYLTAFITVPTGDYRVPLAFITVPNTGTADLTAPLIVPFGSKSIAMTADKLVVNKLSAITANMGSLTAGTGVFGTGTYNTNLTGIALGDLADGNDSGGEPYTNLQFAGQVSGVTQVSIKDGVLYAAAGDIWMNSSGLTLASNGSSNSIIFRRKTSATNTSSINSWYTHPDSGPSGTRWGTYAQSSPNPNFHLSIGTGGEPANLNDHVTEVINLTSNYLSILNNGQEDGDRLYYRFPIETYSQVSTGDVLTVASKSNATLYGNVSKGTVVLEWAAASGGGVTQITAGSGISINQGTGNVTITNTVSDTNTWRGINDTPADGSTAVSISSNWAYDHANNASAHHSSSGSSYTHPDPIRLSDGQESAPTYSFSGSTTTGMYKNSSGLKFSFSNDLKFNLASNYAYVYDKLYIGDVELTSGTHYLKYNSGTVVRVSSTRRAKMNIVDMTVDSSKIYNLQPKDFNFRKLKRDADGKPEIDSNGLSLFADEAIDEPKTFGLIAEDVVSEIPQLVSLDSTGVADGVDYPLLTVLLVEELKKLEARVKTLEG